MKIWILTKVEHEYNASETLVAFWSKKPSKEQLGTIMKDLGDHCNVIRNSLLVYGQYQRDFCTSYYLEEVEENKILC